MKSTPMIIPYSRVSSTRQVSGSGQNRQANTEKLKALVASTGLPVAASIKDVGSGFKGANLRKDAGLGGLKALVEDGNVAKGSILFIDELSRLSRLDPNKGAELFLFFVNRGVAIYTAHDGTMYQSDGESTDMMSKLIVAVLLLSRAHEDSKVKQGYSQRFTTSEIEAFLYKTKDAKGRNWCDDEGSPLAIRSGGTSPFWIDESSGYVKPHPTYFPIIQEIIELRVSHGGSRIAEILNNRGVEAPVTHQGKRKKGNLWSGRVIEKLHLNDNLLGTRICKVAGKEYVLENYYPAVCDEATLHQIRERVSSRHRKGRTSSGHVSLLSGIGIVSCGHCGYAMKLNKKKGDRPRLICTGGLDKTTDCKAWSFISDNIEDLILRIGIDKVWKPTKANNTNTVESIQSQIKTKEAKRDEIEEKMTDGAIDLDSGNRMVSRINSQLDSLKADLKKAVNASSPALDANFYDQWQSLDPKVLEDNELDYRREVKELIRRAIESVVATSTKKRGEFWFDLTFIDGSQFKIFQNKTSMSVTGDVFKHSTPDESISEKFAYLWAGGPKYELNYGGFGELEFSESFGGKNALVEKY